MKTLAVTCLCLFLLVSAASTQQTPQAVQFDATNPDQIQIEQTLQRCLGAYQRNRLPDLLAV
jgi:hypothetical protein